MTSVDVKMIRHVRFGSLIPSCEQLRQDTTKIAAYIIDGVRTNLVSNNDFSQYYERLEILEASAAGFEPARAEPTRFQV
ncbi:hypothetical protein H8356DRAFT_1358961 [Neocallimastix lanati (nom. inval.)]|nr:hypothetical protein H8356DRAFT_1358961 [Neocallimastix sp. JGI-2020a]